MNAHYVVFVQLLCSTVIVQESSDFACETIAEPVISVIEPGVDEIVEISSERERISLTFYWNVSFVSSRYNISLHSAYSTVEYLKECQ